MSCFASSSSYDCACPCLEQAPPSSIRHLPGDHPPSSTPFASGDLRDNLPHYSAASPKPQTLEPIVASMLPRIDWLVQSMHGVEF